MMAYCVSEGRVFSLKASEWLMLLGGATGSVMKLSLTYFMPRRKMWKGPSKGCVPQRFQVREHCNSHPNCTITTLAWEIASAAPGLFPFAGTPRCWRALSTGAPVIDVDFDLRRIDAAPIKVIELS
jgi:hypothetical protein